MKRPTINDVAALAGVSKSLVSLVLRDSPSVSDEKRAAVRKAVAELGYRPNAVARSLVSRRTNVIGVMLTDLHNPFFASVVDGIEEAAAARGYQPLIHTGNRQPAKEARAIEAMIELRTDGLIMVSPQSRMATIAAAAEMIPVVVMTRSSRAPMVDSVVNDDRRGAAMAVEHLASLGHERIVHIDGAGGAGAAARHRAYEATMRRLGRGSHIRVVRGGFDVEGGRAGAVALGKEGMPTAIFAANDQCAIGVLDVLDERGVRVPEDVSVVGYDNIDLAALRRFDLTTVNQPREEMGTAAVELLLERLDGGREEPRRVVEEPTLVVRGTTAPPR